MTLTIDMIQISGKQKDLLKCITLRFIIIGFDNKRENLMFQKINTTNPNAKTVKVTIEGKEITAFQGDTVATVMLVAGFNYFRITPISGKQRAPYCMMGICFDCLVEINGTPNRRACRVLVQEGMRVQIQKREGNLNL